MNIKESPLICSFILSSIIVGIYYLITGNNNDDNNNNDKNEQYIICFLLSYICILFLLFRSNKPSINNTVELPTTSGGNGCCPF